MEHSAATVARVSNETFPVDHYDAIKFNRNSLSLYAGLLNSQHYIGKLKCHYSTCVVWFLRHCLLSVFIDHYTLKIAFLAGRGKKMRYVSL